MGLPPHKFAYFAQNNTKDGLLLPGFGTHQILALVTEIIAHQAAGRGGKNNRNCAAFPEDGRKSWLGFYCVRQICGVSPCENPGGCF